VTVLLTTLGFDEKFQVRAFMRWFKELEGVVIFGSFENDLAKKALNSLVGVINSANVKYEVVEVNPYDFKELVFKVGRKLEDYKGKKLVFNLSGGMRVLSVALLLTLLLKDVDAIVELETEDFKGYFQFSTSDFKPVSLSKDHLEVLKAIKEGYNTVNSIHKRLNMPLSTVWRRVNDLKEMGLIDNGMRLTFKGELVLSTTYFSSD
jgi:CRISPR-associated protein Csa3